MTINRAIALGLFAAVALLAAPLLTAPLLATPAQAQKTVNVVIAQPNVEHPYRVGGINAAKAWAATHPEVKLTILDGRRDSSVQLSGLEDAIVRGADVIIMAPNDSDALKPIAADAKRAKIPLVIFDRKLNVPPADFAAYIGGDSVEMGRVGARFIADRIGGKGVVLQIEGTPGASATIDRKTGFEEVMKTHPGITVFSYVGNYRIQDAAAVSDDALTAHPDVVAVFAHNDSMALGAAQALGERGRTAVPIVGMDGAAEACRGIADGKITGSVYYPTMFPEALELAMRVIAGQEVPKTTLLPTPMLTAANRSQFCQ